MIPIRVLGDRVLVLLPPADEAEDPTTGLRYRPKDTTESGIILAQSPHSYDAEAQTRGIVATLGEKSGTVDRDDVRHAIRELFKRLTDPDEYYPWGRAWTKGTLLMFLTALTGEAERRLLTELSPAPFEVQVGDCVLFGASDGERVDYDGQRYVILREAEILAVVEPAGDIGHMEFMEIGHTNG